MNNNNTGSLSDLLDNNTGEAAAASGPIDMSKMTVADPNELFANSPRRPEPKDPLMEDLNNAIAREKISITNRIHQLEEAQYKEFLDEKKKEEDAIQAEEDRFALEGIDGTSNVSNSTIDEIDYRPAEETPVPVPVTEEPKKTYVLKQDDDTDIDELADLPEVDEEDFEEDPLFADADDIEKKNNEILDNLKKDIKDRIKPIKKTLDLSKFSIAKKSINVQKAMKLAVEVDQNTADWVLPASKKAISVSALSGPEILKLNPENSSRNRLNTFKDMYRIIYDHIIDGNKPQYETWLKQTKFFDIPHIYFAIYMATFGKSNFINYTCPKCQKVFIEDIKFDDMVTYKDDTVKEEIKKILKADTTSEMGDGYNVDLVPISDKYVFGLHYPSIYSVIIETASLSDKFIEKYSDLIDIVSFIDSIYLIDEENNQLIPIDTKPDPNDQAKTSARRIKVFYDIIKTLNSEDYYALRAAMDDYEQNADAISYKVPSTKCPDCGHVIPDNTEIGPDAMLFTRHRLAAIGNM